MGRSACDYLTGAVETTRKGDPKADALHKLDALAGLKRNWYNRPLSPQGGRPEIYPVSHHFRSPMAPQPYSAPVVVLPDQLQFGSHLIFVDESGDTACPE